MKTTVQYLDAIRAKHGLTSDYQLAKLMDIRQSTISGYRAGRSHLDDLMSLKVADLLGIDPMEVISAANAERAKTQAVKEVWASAWMRFAANFEDLLSLVGQRRNPSLA